jgi:hypothetical protein
MVPLHGSIVRLISASVPSLPVPRVSAVRKEIAGTPGIKPRTEICSAATCENQSTGTSFMNMGIFGALFVSHSSLNQPHGLQGQKIQGVKLMQATKLSTLASIPGICFTRLGRRQTVATRAWISPFSSHDNRATSLHRSWGLP